MREAEALGVPDRMPKEIANCARTVAEFATRTGADVRNFEHLERPERPERVRTTRTTRNDPNDPNDPND
jgi:hypothetical protein